MSGWIEYSEKRPDAYGVYEWSIPSETMKGESIVVLAHMRWRGAGCQDVLSPSFDYWDGYRVIVPKGTKWREHNGDHKAIKEHDEIVIGIESRELRKCEFCGELPSIKAWRRHSSGGISITPCPSQLNDFRLECCREGTIKTAESIFEAESQRAADCLKSDAPALLDALEVAERMLCQQEDALRRMGCHEPNAEPAILQARALIAKHRGGK